VKIRFETSDGIVEVSGPEATRDLIEKTLARIQSTQKSKSKLKKSK
jgi:hypothetical protein